MIDKLRIVKQRYDEVSDLIIQPEIIMDQKRYAQLMKEYKDLGSVVKKGDEYQSLISNIEEAKEIIADGSDAEMTEMAKMEIDEASTRIPQLEDEIKFLLIPKDIGLLKAIPFLCRYEWKPIAPKPTDRSAFAEATALHK